ncbi:MAG: phosphoesterase, partial [Marinirhabdus sp.]
QFGQFSYGGVGMAKLDVHKDGSSVVTFLKAGENGNTVELFKKEIIRADKPYNVPNLPSSYPATVTASVYNDSLTQRTKFFKTLWGKHYREVYGTGVRAKVALLDTLYGGLKVVRAGGGHQTRSLRLVSAKGKTYNMRALKKSAVQFIQTVVIKNNIVEDGFTNTLPEDLILDFYTAAHPYGAFSIPKLASAAQVFHTNPKLYFVPKQAALGKFNGAYGDALYMIVERPDENYDGTLFNYADDVESTDNMLDKLRSDEDNVLDEKAYIRARLFDMLIGDWDRHSDQWRFAEYKDQSGKDVFVPIPRDRDQVFANFDGSLLNAVRALFNVARQFQVYGATLKHTAWFNTAGIKLDRAFIENYGREEWAAQANFIKKNVTDAVIEAAFKDLPKETQDSTAESIKQKLKGRRDNIVKIAEEYYDYFSNLQTVTGTDKDDHFEITRMPNGKTEIKVFRIKDGKKGERYINRVYNSKDTREIWVYGLDNDDVFEVKGKGDNPIKLRLIGGQNNDVYRIANGQKVTVYDQRAANNTVEKKSSAAFRFTNNYDFNTYDYLKEQKTTSAVLPSLGYNPDDGFLVGFSAMFTTFGFQRNPFKSQHRFSGGYYFATSSYNINYEGEFANIFGDFNFIVGGGFRSPSFSENFFGFGNGTENPQNLQPDRFGLDYNRTRIGKYSAKVGLKRDPGYGSTFRYHLNFEAFGVENTPNRFISLFPELMLGQTQFFGTVAANYTYESYDNRINPSRGMHFALATGATQNLKDSDRVFGFVKPQLGFYNAITNNKKLVLKTAVLGHFNIGNHYEFYQGAQLGRDHGLRGFRRQRFNGRSAAAASADIRYSFNSFKTGLAPVQIGIFGGYDVGRVWVANDTSNLWHTSYGGGFWVNLSDLVSGTLNTFASKEGLQIAFRIAVSM